MYTINVCLHTHVFVYAPSCPYNRKRNTYPITVRFIYYIIILYMSVMYLMNGNVGRKKSSTSLSDQMLYIYRRGTEFCQYIAPNIIPMTFGNVLRLRCLPLSEFEMFYVPKKILIRIMCVLLV